MVDWLTIWGVTRAAGLVFKPILEELATESAKDYAKDFFKDCLKQVIRLPEKDAQKEAYGKALKEFLQFVQQELEDADYQDAQIKQFTEPLRQLIQQDAIAAALGRAFEADCKGLDLQLLAQTWQGLNPPTLPPDFSWERVSKRYLKRVKAIVHESDQLRPIFAAQTQTAMAEGVQELVGIAPEFDLARYAEGLREQHSYPKLESLDAIAVHYSGLKLWKVFVPQNVRECQEFLPQVYEIPKEHGRRLRQSGQLDEVELVEAELERSRRVYIEQPIRSVLEVVGDPMSLTGALGNLLLRYDGSIRYDGSARYNSALPRVVILGDPGSGKSTLLQYIALVWAERPLAELPLHPIPLLLELRTYARDKQTGKCQDLLEFIHAGNVICRLNQQQLHDTLKTGQAIALFDGIDEVFDSSLQDEVVTDIHRFTNDYPTVQVIVTSRWLGYKAQQLRAAGFQHFMLQDLDEAKIAAFMQRWHDLTFADTADKQRKQERLQKAIQESKAIRELAGNPLLLTMMAILNRNQELPRDRPELYNQASRVLLHQWDVERALVEDQRLDPKTIDYRDKQAMLRKVAYHMQSSAKGLAGNIISASDLESILAEYLKAIEIEQPRTAARLMIQQLRTRNFILCYLGADSYAFVHRTFLEYFCAWEFIDQFEKQRILTEEQLEKEVFDQHWQDESWHEVLRLICGMIGEQIAGKMVKSLIHQNNKSGKFTHLFLAADCLTEIRNQPVIKQISTQLLDRLMTIADWGELYYDECIQKIGKIDQGTPEAWSWFKSHIYFREVGYHQSDPAIEVIIQNYRDYPETLTWLKSCVQSNDWCLQFAAVHGLCMGWKDHPETFTILKSLAQTNKNSIASEQALRGIAKHYRDDPNILPWLKSCLHVDREERLRGAVIEALAQYYGDDPETLLLIKSHLQSDESEWVQRETIRALVRYYRDDPETLLLIKSHLKSHLQSDERGWVRGEAIRALVQYYRDDPETLPLIKSHLQSDENEKVRRETIRALAQYYRDDPETLLLIKSHLQSDESEAIRSGAIELLAQYYGDDPETLLLIKSHLQSDERGRVRGEAIEVLAQYYRDDPETLPLIKSHLQSDENERVRCRAIQALAQYYRDDPELLFILRLHTQSDKDAGVRVAAMRELIKCRRIVPDMFEFLSDRALHDPFEGEYDWQDNPRQNALKAIVVIYPGNPQILELLSDRAQNDPDEQVREFAKQQLAKLETQK